MKKITAYIMVMAILLTVCNVQKSYGQASTTAAAGSQEKQKTESEIGKKIKPLVSEKIDTSKQGVGMRMSGDTALFAEMTKGDDGSCYYFRNEGKGKNKKIVFYKNNGIKVCETTMKKSFEKEKYYISSFVKYGEKFFVVLDQVRPFTVHAILTTLDMATGKWGKTIKFENIYNSYIIYDNKFYCIAAGSEITVYDLSGAKTKLKDLTEFEEDYIVYGDVQCIVDGKIYYLKRYVKEVSMPGDEDDITKIMRCSLDGSEEEELFECNREGSRMMGSMKMDADCIYLRLADGGYNLMRIPLYGGKIKGIKKVGAYFELSNDNIFFSGANTYDDLDGAGANDYIYKVDKDLSEESKAVTKAYYYDYDFYTVDSAPFYYADGHLVVQGFDKKERKCVFCMFCHDHGSRAAFVDAITTYAPDWYWVSEDGEIEDTIKGTGLKKKCKKEYKKYHK